VELGRNDKGQLGDSTTQPRKKPVQVKGLTNIVAIDAGEGSNHGLALDVGGNVWAWGFNSTGQLGDGTVKSRPTPELVHNLDRVIAIAAGVAHSLALRADGTVRAWGANGRGQLGDGSTNQHELPIQVPMLSSIVAIAAGEHSLALHSSGTVWAWGPMTGVSWAMTQPGTATTRLQFWTGRAAPNHSDHRHRGGREPQPGDPGRRRGSRLGPQRRRPARQPSRCRRNATPRPAAMT
jgi:alpha-tubulin suppressor-like RCC1 family protein